jgi:cell wall-associated NlpC family hydrolase
LSFKKLFPYALAACFGLAIFPTWAAAQSGETRQRQVTQNTETYNLSALDNDPVIVSLASAEDVKVSKSSTAKSGRTIQFQQLLTAAIEQRLGARYSYGSTGPGAFDCSGFVWSVFQSAGIDFERSSARSLWARFTPPAPEEQFQLGNLVFFSNLQHIGIVADAHGFYHASRSHGVVYSPFNDYWVSRIDGFRKVPMVLPATAD